MMTKAFVNHRNNGFRLNFPNGESLSTVWGEYTYTDNYYVGHEIDEVTGKTIDQKLESNTVEILPVCSPEKIQEIESVLSESQINTPVYDYLDLKQWIEVVKILLK